MATITVNYGSGGGHMAPFGHDSQPPLAEVLRDIADDLGGIQCATIVSADAADLGTAITLVNEIKGALNAVAGTTLKTLKG